MPRLALLKQDFRESVDVVAIETGSIYPLVEGAAMLKAARATSPMAFDGRDTAENMLVLRSEGL
jgi:hypothetical protein